MAAGATIYQVSSRVNDTSYLSENQAGNWKALLHDFPSVVDKEKGQNVIGSHARSFVMKSWAGRGPGPEKGTRISGLSRQAPRICLSARIKRVSESEVQFLLQT